MSKFTLYWLGWWDLICLMLLVTAIKPFNNMILAVLYIATYNPSSSDNGMFLEDVWDELALLGFDVASELNLVHCPVLVTQEEGSSQSAKLMSQVVSLLLDAQPVAIPEGQ
jgi:hypothetical protein